MTFVPATSAGVAVPLPPFATAKVPANVIVPLVVIGPPVVVSPVVPPETSTDVTVPDPPLLVVSADGGGPSCKSSSDIWLPPPPARLNRVRKNRYHSREIIPVRESMISTLAEGMLVIFGCSGIGRRHVKLSAHDRYFYRISARNFIHAVTQL